VDRLLLATTNPNKVREIRPLLADLPFELITLADLDPVPEPAETGATFWENARIKALAYASATGHTAVAEDSGLEIDALGGEPGVLSARFLSASASYPERFAAIFQRLGAKSRDARFITALAVARGTAILFETETSIEGSIAAAAAGQHGFGYDPIFFYSPLGCTTAQLVDSEKSMVSHRARAFRDLHRWLVTKSASRLIQNSTIGRFGNSHLQKHG
jgi:XTP/dITP diphosphohydrolase